MPLAQVRPDEAPIDRSNEDNLESGHLSRPRKNPRKSSSKQRPQPRTEERIDRPESGQAAGRRAHSITPQNRPDVQHSPFYDNAHVTASPHKARSMLLANPRPVFQPLATPSDNALGTPKNRGSIFKKRSFTSTAKKEEEAKRNEELNDKLWELCGRDIKRWNRGDFDGDVFKVKAKRW